MNRSVQILVVFWLSSSYVLCAQARYFGFGADPEIFGFQTVEQMEETCLTHNVGESSKSYQVVSRILKQMGLYDLSFKMSECPNIKNARAQLVTNENDEKEHFIIYDGDWLNQLSQRTTNWAAIGVLAHEIAHFQLDHEVRGGGSRPDWELEADRFLGFQLAKMGATLEQAQSCFQKASVNGTRTHPAKAKRLEAVEIGWSRFRLESANQLTEDTRLRDVTPQLILDRFSKELGGYQGLNRIDRINYEVDIKQTNTIQNFKTNSFEYGLEIAIEPNEAIIIDREQDETFKIIAVSTINGDSILRKRPINSNDWLYGAPPNGTGTTVKIEDHHFIEQHKPRLSSVFDHLRLTSKPDKTQFNYLRVPFNDVECYVLELPQRIIERGSKLKNWFRAKLNTKNYYSTITGLLVGSVQEEEINYFKKNKSIPKKDKEFVRKTSFYNYQDFYGILIPTEVSSIIQERNDRGVLLDDRGKIEQERILKNITVELNSN